MRTEKRLLAALVIGSAAFSMIACGNVTADPSVSPALGGAVTLRGVVRDAAGAPVAGVRVVAQGRLTDHRLEASGRSAADGSFSLTGPAGVYDLVLDRADDPAFATCYYGPVVLQAGAQREFVLQSAAGVPRSQVWGRMWLRSGVASAGRQVRLTAATAWRHGGEPAVPEAQQAQTDADGRFVMQLGDGTADVALNVEAYDEHDRLDEFVSIAVMAKPTYVEFATEEVREEDTTRAGEEAPSATAVMEAPELALAGVQRLQGRGVGSLNNQGQYTEYVFDNGRIPVGPKGQSEDWWEFLHYLAGSSTNAGVPLHSFMISSNNPPYRTSARMGLSKDGGWLYDYRFRINAGASYRGSLKLFDATGDSYSLTVNVQFTHVVDFNSSDPTIVRVEIDVPTWYRF